MFNLSKLNFLEKIVVGLVAVTFFATTLVCFAMMANGMHSTDGGQFCTTVVSAVDNVILQTGLFLLLLVLTATLIFNTRFGNSFSEIQQKLLTIYYGPPLNKNYYPREYSYLNLLFSKGLINTKIYHVAF